MAKQPLSKALNAVAQQTGAEISFDPATVKGLTAPELNGDLTIEQALGRLLEGTKLNFRRTDKGVYLVFPLAGTATQVDAEPALVEGLPEILVSGKRYWSMNTGIARTEDDTQPFIIFDQEQIQRSGATTLEDFFRQQLTTDNSASTSDQARPTRQGLTSVNLRGLGSNETLILIDGRRVSGASNITDANLGILGQAQISGIPLDSIERIEVLASSASGIYGSNAAGGVVNIVLRRDYKGFQATLSKGGTFNGGGGTRRLDVAGGASFEGGRTRLSFFGSVNEADPLLQGQRDFLKEARPRLLASDPNYYTTGPGSQFVLTGATPNIRSANGSNLTLKNGTPLNSPITYLPDGYTSANGTAPLVANAGKYNLDLAPNAAGAGAPVLLGQRSKSGTAAIRREFTDWLGVYGQVSSSVAETTSPSTRVPDSFVLVPSAPNNPFKQAIFVAAPAIGADSASVSRTTNQTVVLGATVKLPHQWQMILDASKNWGKYSSGGVAGQSDLATSLGILKGTIDIFRDNRQSPIAYGYNDPSIGSFTTPAKSTGNNVALRLAGPIPIDLPGGRPAATFLVERNREWLGGVTSVTGGTPPTAPASLSADVSTLTSAPMKISGNIIYLPQRSRDTKSLYGEIRLPIFGEKNQIPLVKSLEVGIAGRQDRYDEKGYAQMQNGLALSNITCAAVSGFIQPTDLAAPCPSASNPLTAGTSKRKTFNPTLSLRWQVQDDVALRASYATGFVPPLLNQLQRNAPTVLQTQLLSLFGINVFGAKDPLRGNEVLGSKTPTVAYTAGGNPDVLPETSKTSSAGIVLTPRFIPDLRLSVDWTHIAQKDNYFDPSVLMRGTLSPSLQAAFAGYLQSNPERFTRGPASDGFSVGPITAIDASIGNLLRTKVDAIDLAASYQLVFQGIGTLDLSARATYLKSLIVQVSPANAPVQAAGVANSGFTSSTSDGAGGGGGVHWKGNLAATWSTPNWSFGSRVRFLGSYYLDTDRSAIFPGQGSSTVPKQIYVDLYGSYKLPHDTELRLTANNAFNRAPPFDASNGNGYYSRFADPRMAYYTIGLTKQF